MAVGGIGSIWKDCSVCRFTIPSRRRFCRGALVLVLFRHKRLGLVYRFAVLWIWTAQYGVKIWFSLWIFWFWKVNLPSYCFYLSYSYHSSLRWSSYQVGIPITRIRIRHFRVRIGIDVTTLVNRRNSCVHLKETALVVEESVLRRASRRVLSHLVDRFRLFVQTRSVKNRLTIFLLQR